MRHIWCCNDHLLLQVALPRIIVLTHCSNYVRSVNTKTLEKKETWRRPHSPTANTCYQLVSPMERAMPTFMVMRDSCVFEAFRTSAACICEIVSVFVLNFHPSVNYLTCFEGETQGRVLIWPEHLCFLTEEGTEVPIENPWKHWEILQISQRNALSIVIYVTVSVL